MIERNRPIVVAVHPKLKLELDLRRDLLTHNYIPKGGIKTASELAAAELESIRKSEEELKQDSLTFRNPKKFKFEIKGCEEIFVEMATYIKLFKFVATLNKKKDRKQINVDLSKIKGLKKNDCKIYW